MAYKVAVVGATGNVGREMLQVLVERQFPASEVVALASTRSVGTEVSFGDGVLKIKALDYYDFKGTDLCLMSAGSAIAKEWAPKIAATGCIVIDNSSHWRMDRAVPLVVPEVNAAALDGINSKARRNCHRRRATWSSPGSRTTKRRSPPSPRWAFAMRPMSPAPFAAGITAASAPCVRPGRASFSPS